MNAGWFRWLTVTGLAAIAALSPTAAHAWFVDDVVVESQSGPFQSGFATAGLQTPQGDTADVFAEGAVEWNGTRNSSSSVEAEVSRTYIKQSPSDPPYDIVVDLYATASMSYTVNVGHIYTGGSLAWAECNSVRAEYGMQTTTLGGPSGGFNSSDSDEVELELNATSTVYTTLRAQGSAGLWWSGSGMYGAVAQVTYLP